MLVVSAEHVAAREIRIRLAPAELVSQLEGDVELTFTLAFPDRRGALDCQHRGIGDEYYAEITLKLHEGMLVSASVRQDVYLGAI